MTLRTCCVRFRDMGRDLIAALVLLGAASVPLQAQEPIAADTLVRLDSLIVTAERVRTPLAESVAAVSILGREELSETPSATLAEALRQVPGFALVDFDGSGRDPQVMARGMYGGGEAEYVVVLLDGHPMNDVQSGIVAWDAIPLWSVERVEVLRGGASALWGDAAVGGVINVVTRDGAREDPVHWHVTTGSHGSWQGGGSLQGSNGERMWSVLGGVDHTDGYRAHGERTAGHLAGRVDLHEGLDESLRLSVMAHWRDFSDPGPLLADDLEADRRLSDVFYQFDHTRDYRVQTALDGERPIGAGGRLSASVSAERRSSEAVRTVALSPDFADTKLRDLSTTRVQSTWQLYFDELGWSGTDRLVVGADLGRATLESSHYEVLSGARPQYEESTGARGALDAAGEGHRTTAAVFAHYTLRPTAAVRLLFGVRGDWLRDGFDDTAPESDGSVRAKHSAVSPRIGLNVRYLDGATQSGNLYVSAGRSFKTPTLDQLFDQRTFPVPFPPFSISSANPDLVPQRGRSLEVGAYHRMALSPNQVEASVSLAAYQTDMKDELDFDLETLGYLNIGRSRHRGIEAGLHVRTAPAGGRFFLNYTQQHAVARAGDHAGRYLKAIPRRFLSGGLGLTPAGRLDVDLVVTHARDVYLDDPNTIELPPYTRADARLSHPIAGMDLFLNVRNLLDSSYSTTGFPDPAGSGAVYYRPGAERAVELGFRGAF